jgi:hypothetical protein
MQVNDLASGNPLGRFDEVSSNRPFGAYVSVQRLLTAGQTVDFEVFQATTAVQTVDGVNTVISIRRVL